MSGGFLSLACAQARERVAAARDQIPDAQLFARAAAAPPAPSFADALRDPRHAGGGLAVIAEVKRASPSRGAMVAIEDPAALARSYAAGGAAAVSVLTEPEHFRGSLADLEAVTRAVDCPVLRKDFVVDRYQLAEARVRGAAAVLLIVAALDDDTLAHLLAEAGAVGLDTLVEAHSETEVERAAAAHDAAGTPRRLVLGINARNLATLDVDLAVVERMASRRPPGALLVAESGVHGPDDATRMAATGADAILVGEHVATAIDPAGAVAALVRAGRPTPPQGPHTCAVPAS